MEGNELISAVSNSSVNGYILIAILVLFWGGAILWGRKSNTVTAVHLEGPLVVVTLLGPARVLSLRKQVTFPLASVVSIVSTPNVFGEGGSFTRRIGSVTIPTFFRVGSFRGARNQGASFWACFRGESAVTIQLTGQKYQFVVLDVEDPNQVVNLLKRR